MTKGKDGKQSSVMRGANRYLIASFAILIWLGLLSAYWPAALVIAVIGGIIWRSRKSSHKQLPEITAPLDQLTENIPVATQVSSSMPTVTASIPGPVITIEYNINRSISRSTMPGTNDVQWASYEDVLEVASYRIEHPMTYWAAGKTRIAEASCIEKICRLASRYLNRLVRSVTGRDLRT